MTWQMAPVTGATWEALCASNSDIYLSSLAAYYTSFIGALELVVAFC